MKESGNIRILITDDEQHARNRLHMMLKELDIAITVSGEASNGREAINLIKKEKPDLLFLDIQMPVLDGFDVIELLGDDCPPVIFVTAYDEYAIKAFEVHAVDYLLKPVRKDRLKEAVYRVIKKMESGAESRSIKQMMTEIEPRPRNLLHKVPVNYKKEIRLIDHHEIFWFEADGKYTRVHTTGGKTYLCDFNLSNIEERLNNTTFLRIHRSAIANLDYTEKIEPWFKGGYRITLKDGTELDVARRRVDYLKAKLGL